MKRFKVVCFSFGFFCLLACPGIALAEECDYNWVLANTDGTKATPDQYAEKARREKECRERLAEQKNGGKAARLEKEAEEQKRAAAEAKANREATAEAMRASQQGKLMEDQEKMLKGLGVKLADEGDEDEDGVDPVELQMYQEMLKNGLAPTCKGKQGEALIACVDAVLEAE